MYFVVTQKANHARDYLMEEGLEKVDGYVVQWLYHYKLDWNGGCGKLWKMIWEFSRILKINVSHWKMWTSSQHFACEFETLKRGLRISPFFISHFPTLQTTCSQTILLASKLTIDWWKFAWKHILVKMIIIITLSSIVAHFAG